MEEFYLKRKYSPVRDDQKNRLMRVSLRVGEKEEESLSICRLSFFTVIQQQVFHTVK